MAAKSSNSQSRIADVARLAGVSPATVSRVMNGRKTVDPALAKRVKDVAAELNYKASPLARSLALGRTHTIAVVVPDLTNPTFLGILRGLTLAAGRDGYRVLIADTSENVDEERSIASEIRRRCDAIVLCAPRMLEDELREIRGELEPLVVINRPIDDFASPSVRADYRSGIIELADHLYELGHRKLVYLAGAHSSVSNRFRLDGLVSFMDAHPGTSLTVLDGGVTFEGGVAAASAVIGSDATAVLAFNDLVAMGLISELRSHGIDVPGEISITGFDDIPFAAYSSPPLTTATVPVTELGEKAWDRMSALLRGEEPGDPVVFEPQLVARGSTAQVATA